jgi:pyruvate dehydrogenase E2 component (dihydrolipoamide acetyltransferase)
MASPLVRRLAREEGIDLADVGGSGPHGRIVKRDLEAFVASGGSAPTKSKSNVPSSGVLGYERLPARVEKASQMRKTIARRLVESKQNVPHFYLTIDIDASAMIVAREQMNALLKDEKVSFNDLVIKATAIALRRVPEVNASWMDGEIHFHQVVDVSVAVAVADGLVTPVVRDADKLGVLAISREVKELAEKARTKKLKPEEMMNGTFSVSNLGMFGIEEFGAVINPPEGAILAVGALRDDVGVVNGQVAPVKRMKVTMSCDHRVVDGALGARWLAELKKLLENPMGMLL